MEKTTHNARKVLEQELNRITKQYTGKGTKSVPYRNRLQGQIQALKYALMCALDVPLNEVTSAQWKGIEEKYSTFQIDI